MCETFTKRPREDDRHTIAVRKSTDNIPQDHDILTRMVQEEGHKTLDDKGQAAVVKLFSHLQMAHDNLALVVGQIATLGKILKPEQFTFVMQNKRLTAEETFEEECSNKILP